MKQTQSSALPGQLAAVVGVLFAVSALIPFAIVGESWGMLWFYLTAPVSMVVEATFGIGKESYGLIVLTSLVWAAGWAAMAYGFAKVLQRWRGCRTPPRN